MTQMIFYLGQYSKTYGSGKGMAADLKYIGVCRQIATVSPRGQNRE
jgi:hypothetical protein